MNDKDKAKFWGGVMVLPTVAGVFIFWLGLPWLVASTASVIWPDLGTPLFLIFLFLTSSVMTGVFVATQGGDS